MTPPPAGNDISRVDGLTGLTRLTELVLDRNRIKVYLFQSSDKINLLHLLQTFHERSFCDLVNLRVLLVEENRFWSEL